MDHIKTDSTFKYYDSDNETDYSEDKSVKESIHSDDSKKDKFD